MECVLDPIDYSIYKQLSTHLINHSPNQLRTKKELVFKSVICYFRGRNKLSSHEAIIHLYIPIIKWRIISATKLPKWICNKNQW
jgi:hypothetical protein